MEESYPFGEPIREVTWDSKGSEPVFVIGVYPSAVHARWVDPSGHELVAALAVANEPEPFWNGEGSADLIEIANKRVPPAAGHLEGPRPANGVSGTALDTFVLEPLGLTRADIHVADIRNRYMANEGQQKAVDREYVPRIRNWDLPEVQWTLRQDISVIPSDRKPLLEDEFREADPAGVITLGNETLKALKLEPLSAADYGKPRPITVFGKQVKLLALVHTRQAARHGHYSKEWNHVHGEWIKKRADSWRAELTRDLRRQ